MARVGYFNVRRGMTTRGYTLALSSDSARWAVIRLWDKAKNLGGAFDSEEQLAEEMGRYYRHVAELRAKGWLEGPEGLDVHDWQEDQVDPDPSAAERQRKHRALVAGNRDKSQNETVTSHKTKRDFAVTSRPSRAPARMTTETETETELTPIPPTGALAVTRPDVEAVCDRLADRIEENGSKRPNVAGWRDEARRLLDIDRRPLDEVLALIDWCQSDSFWRANIMSVGKLRTKYDQLRLQSQRQPALSATGQRMARLQRIAEGGA